MTAVADLLSRADRDRLAGRIRELGDVARLMRERPAVPKPAPPEPLHRMARRRGGQDHHDVPAPGGAAQEGTT